MSVFCSNCGYELPDGVQFCSKCGTRIRNGDLVVVKEEEFENNAPVSAKFENITVQNQFSERVNSELFADRRSQNKLFSVYAELIAPVKKIEGLTEQISECNKKMAYLKDENNAEMPQITRLTVIAFIIFAVLFWLDGSPVETVSEMIMPGIVEPVLQWAMEQDAFLIKWSITLIMGLFTMFTIPLLFTIAFRILWHMIVARNFKKIKYRNNLTQAEQIEHMRDGLLGERDAICLEVKDKLMYVPKKYRYSEAISYFVDLYNSSRVDTLKEAVNTYAHDKQEAEKLQQIMGKIDGVMRYLALIEERLY